MGTGAQKGLAAVCARVLVSRSEFRAALADSRAIMLRPGGLRDLHSVGVGLLVMLERELWSPGSTSHCEVEWLADGVSIGGQLRHHRYHHDKRAEPRAQRLDMLGRMMDERHRPLDPIGEADFSEIAKAIARAGAELRETHAISGQNYAERRIYAANRICETAADVAQSAAMSTTDTALMTIGEGIKKLRRQRGLTQRELAPLVGVDQSRVSRWEDNIEHPNGAHLVALQRELRPRKGDFRTGEAE
jgi:DNA-binding transcriptional regulator YiaG